MSAWGRDDDEEARNGDERRGLAVDKELMWAQRQAPAQQLHNSRRRIPPALLAAKAKSSQATRLGAGSPYDRGADGPTGRRHSGPSGSGRHGRRGRRAPWARQWSTDSSEIQERKKELSAHDGISGRATCALRGCLFFSGAFVCMGARGLGGLGLRAAV